MILLENTHDLRRILRNPALFSRDPVFLHLSELPPPDLITYEKRINALKKENSRFPGFRIALTALALLSCIYLNTAYTPESNLLPAVALISGLSVGTGIAGTFLHRWFLKKMIRREVKKLLKRLCHPHPDPFMMALR